MNMHEDRERTAREEANALQLRVEEVGAELNLTVRRPIIMLHFQLEREFSLANTKLRDAQSSDQSTRSEMVWDKASCNPCPGLTGVW